MPLFNVRLQALFLLALPVTAATFSATSGSVTITDAYGGPEGGVFHLTGPQVDVMASGGSTPSFETTQLLNTPFNLNLNVLVNDIGGDSGSGVVGGVTYPSLAFSGPSLVISNVSPITISAGNLTVTTAATLSGTLQGCVPANFCIYGGGAPTFPFMLSVGPVAGLLTVTYANINPPVASQYALTSAIFTVPVVTAVPEPGTWISGLMLFAVAAGSKYRRRFHLTS